MTREEKSALLLQLIAEKSATAEGFFTADAKQLSAEKNIAKVCRQQLADGTLFRVRANQTMYAYFRTQVMANTYMREHQNALLAKAATKLSFEPKQTKANPHKAVAEPIYTAQTRYIRQMMPDRHHVEVPFLRIGQPGFSMSI
jgi:hypothetical protein